MAEADGEPDKPTEVNPRIPTAANVAKEATYSRAIKLNRMSLLGVFGSSANRADLVRMPSGKVMKVKVGDRLYGGQVTAIGDDSLYYVKNGRNYQLAMPKG